VVCFCADSVLPCVCDVNDHVMHASYDASCLPALSPSSSLEPGRQAGCTPMHAHHDVAIYLLAYHVSQHISISLAAADINTSTSKNVATILIIHVW